MQYRKSNSSSSNSINSSSVTITNNSSKTQQALGCSHAQLPRMLTHQIAKQTAMAVLKQC
jgi:hypothetical protein